MQKTLVGRILLATALAFAFAVHAQDYPTKPIRIIVPYPPGGGVDFMARIVAEKLREKWDQPAIVESRVGGGGNVGTEYVAKASPDGHTLLFVAPGPMVINKSLYGKLAFDPDTMVPVSVVATITNVLAVHPRLAAGSVQQLITYAKANPGRLNYATQAIGSVAHLTGELFQSMAGINIVHIPYKGAAPAIADLLGGQVDMAFLELSVVLPHIRAGKLRGLAVGDEKRNSSLPDTPAMSEVVPGLVFVTWYGVVAPPKTPSTIANKLSAAITEAVKQPDVAQQIRDRNAEVAGSTPDEMALLMREERERYGKVIRATGMTAQ
jgi:tripartite-type tricarboxylate transporter receptor subunit TctC